MAAVESIALLSSFAAIVIDKLFSDAVEELGLQCGVEKELDRVRSLLKAIGPALEDTAGWCWSSTSLRNLADVAYELDDALDELEWEARQSSLEVHGSSFSAFSYRFLFGNQLSHKFETIVKKLEMIDKDHGPLGTPRSEGGRPMINPKSRYFNTKIFSDKVWGTNKMVALLLESSSQSSHPRELNGILESKNISVIVVEGCGGFGKTTLMKQVYKDGRVRKHFDLRIWLSASAGPAGSSILDSIVVEDMNNTVLVKLRNLRLLVETFDELLLAGSRFLLVLDDVQDEHLNGWDDLCRNLIVGEEGSKVVVTTRSSDLAKMLSHTGIKELPVSIGELKHLRFLNLSHTRIKSLPESLANLRKLQILDLSGCIMLCSFPTWINKISSLRHLKARPDLICTIEGIGKLSSLQDLEEFRVRKNEGHKIEELKNMKELHGKLQIRNIENVKSEIEARGADLLDKVYLEGLELQWSDDRHDDELIDTSVDDEEILGGLSAPSNLKMISIKGFDGRKSPAWMRSLVSFSELQTICLKDCRKWEVLPPLGELPRLKFLELCGMEGVRKVDNRTYGLGRFGSLAELRLHGLSRWDEWLGVDDLFPVLRVLEIKDCPMLRTMPPLPSALRELRIERVGLVTLHDTLRCRNEDDEESIYSAQPPTLSSIYISDCPSLTMVSEISYDNFLHNRNTTGIRQVYNWLLTEDAPSAKLTAALPSSIKTLKIVGSPGIVGAPLFAELQTRKLLSFTVAKAYADIASCKQEALRHLTALQSMTVSYRKSLLPSSASSVLLEYTMSPDGSSKVIVTVRERPPSDLFANSTAEIIGRHLQTLKHLELTNCPDITSFSDEQLNHLPALEDLTILSCCSLQSVQIRSFNCALKRLEMQNCTKLSSFTVTPEDQEDHSPLQRPPTSLQSLVLHGCSSLLFLPTNTRSLESLQVLHIENCPQLRCLPDAGLPISLRELVIQQSPVVASRCRRESDPDWHKIAFIPNIDID
ncbi:putative disease resistance protein [Ananas comosus]|uniref:Putative disease resistance protein n=1 Tax=Ananas comosus TaxID=4615 RepID=A0A199V5J7_ANACO|nr:putative disease resistance protein [Ananas comosus]